jgi:hypothetical protein
VLLITALGGCGSGVSVSDDVKLENATAHLMSQGTCPTTGGALAPCTAYELTFSVANNGATKWIDRVEDVKVSTGGQELQAASAVGCGGEPWTITAGAASGVLSIFVSFGPQASLSIPCDVSTAADVDATTILSAPSAAGDSFDVKIEGLLSDAQPFMATAHAPIL